MEQINFTISPELNNLRLDKAACMMSALSRARVQRLIDDNCVTLNGIIVSDQDVKVKTDDSIVISMPEPKPSAIVPKEIEFEVVYEDEHLLVINKPAGLTVHPGSGNQDNTLVNALVQYYGAELSQIGGVLRPGIVHRLDKDTSGLMVVAKTDASHLALSEQISQRSAKRVYKAVIWGVPVKTSALIETHIGRNPHNRLQMKVTRQGKYALTEYTLLKVFAGRVASIVECRLGTGRTHQIRVHMSHIGHSIIGDQVYGKNARKICNYLSSEQQQQLENFKRQALHSAELSFVHPDSGAHMHFKADLPADMQQLIDILDNV